MASASRRHLRIDADAAVEGADGGYGDAPPDGDDAAGTRHHRREHRSREHGGSSRSAHRSRHGHRRPHGTPGSSHSMVSRGSGRSAKSSRSGRSRVHGRNRPPSQRTPRDLAASVGDSPGSTTPRQRWPLRSGEAAFQEEGADEGEYEGGDAVGLDDIPVDLGVAGSGGEGLEPRGDTTYGTPRSNRGGGRREHGSGRRHRRRSPRAEPDAAADGDGTAGESHHHHSSGSGRRHGREHGSSRTHGRRRRHREDGGGSRRHHADNGAADDGGDYGTAGGDVAADSSAALAAEAAAHVVVDTPEPERADSTTATARRRMARRKFSGTIQAARVSTSRSPRRGGKSRTSPNAGRPESAASKPRRRIQELSATSYSDPDPADRRSRARRDHGVADKERRPSYDIDGDTQDYGDGDGGVHGGGGGGDGDGDGEVEWESARGTGTSHVRATGGTGGTGSAAARGAVRALVDEHAAADGSGVNGGDGAEAPRGGGRARNGGTARRRGGGRGRKAVQRSISERGTATSPIAHGAVHASHVRRGESKSARPESISSDSDDSDDDAGRVERRRGAAAVGGEAKLDELNPEPEAGSMAAQALSRELAAERKRHRPQVVKLIVDGREKVEQKKAARKKDKEIDEDHTLYHLSYGMMFGISNALRMYGKRQDLVMSHFMHVHKYVFPPKKGHILNHTFKFKDYCPEVFRHLRERFGISDSDYLESFSGKYNFIEFISNSKSGQFFFYSHNGRLMIKTQSEIESKFLRRIMPHYYRYVMKNPHTFITRFYGMHRLKMNYLGRKLHFVVMQSVFEGDAAIHETYDLKGSTHGRAATEKEKARGPAKCVYKDLDMLERVRRVGKLHFGAKRRDFMQQIERDVAFLERMKIMDYSLLVGIHYKSRSREKGLRRRSVQLSPDAKWDHMQLRKLRQMHEARTKGTQLGALDEDGGEGASDAGSDALSGAGDPVDDTRAPASGAGSATAAVARRRRGPARRLRPGPGGPRTPRGLRSAASVPALLANKRRHPIRDIFTKSDDLCIDGDTGDGSYCDEIYYMGIIDILQQYDTKKGIETIFKSLFHKKNTISSVNPTQYGDRFKQFMGQITD